MKKSVLNIVGMTCAHCVNKIETALNGMEGVEHAKVNLKKGTVKIKYDETVQTIDNFTQTVHEVGYEVE